MSDNAHCGMVAHQLAVDAAEDDEPKLIEAPVYLHLSDEGLFCAIDEDDVGHGTQTMIYEHAIEEIERRLFNRFPEVLLQNAEENLTPESRRMTEDPIRVASVEWYPDVERIGGVAISMDQRAQWTMIPRPDEGGESA